MSSRKARLARHPLFSQTKSPLVHIRDERAHSLPWFHPRFAPSARHAHMRATSGHARRLVTEATADAYTERCAHRSFTVRSFTGGTCAFLDPRVALSRWPHISVGRNARHVPRAATWATRATLGRWLHCITRPASSATASGGPSASATDRRRQLTLMRSAHGRRHFRWRWR